MTTTTECPANLESILDLPVMLTVELGACQKSTRELMGLNIGSVVELENRPGGQVNLYAGRKLVARGEVVIVDDSLAIKVITIVSGSEMTATA